VATEPVIAADLGGTLLRVGVVDDIGQILHSRALPVAGRQGNAQIGALLTEALGDAHAWALSHGIHPSGVGLAVPGLVDRRHGIMRFSSNLAVREFPIVHMAQQALSLPTALENDVRAGAWGEWRLGAGRGARHMVFVSVGTGISAAMINQGHLYRGAHGGAGELGHIVMVDDGETCRCGNRGCLETLAAGWGIVRRAQQMAPSRFPPPTEGTGQTDVTAEMVVMAAARGDPAAMSIIDAAGEYLGRAVALLSRLLDPDRIVLGGGMLHGSSPLVPAVRSAIEATAFDVETPPTVALAQFGGQTGLVGAACLVFAPDSQHGESPGTEA